MAEQYKAGVAQPRHDPGPVTCGHYTSVIVQDDRYYEDTREMPGKNANNRFRFNADGVLMIKRDGETDAEFDVRVDPSREGVPAPVEPACDYCEDTGIGKLGMDCPACGGIK